MSRESDEVTMRYFKGDKATAKSLLDEWKESSKPLNEAVAALQQRFGAIGTYGNSRSISGLLHKEKPTGSGLKIDTIHHQGEKLFVSYPDRRYKEGKVYANELNHCNKLKAKHPDFSGFVVKKLAVDCQVIGPASGSRTGAAMYFSVAGVVKNTLVVKIPAGGDSSSDPFPPIPDCLTEIKKSEFVALTEE